MILLYKSVLSIEFEFESWVLKKREGGLEIKSLFIIVLYTSIQEYKV